MTIETRNVPKRLHHGNGHPIEQHVETRNVRNGSTGLGTLWGTRLFGRAAVPESSTSSSSYSYGPPLAGGVDSYNHLWRGGWSGGLRCCMRTP